MKTCPVCGAQMPDSQNLCPACGADYVEAVVNDITAGVEADPSLMLASLEEGLAGLDTVPMPAPGETVRKMMPLLCGVALAFCLLSGVLTGANFFYLLAIVALILLVAALMRGRQRLSAGEVVVRAAARVFAEDAASVRERFAGNAEVMARLDAMELRLDDALAGQAAAHARNPQKGDADCGRRAGPLQCGRRRAGPCGTMPPAGSRRLMPRSPNGSSCGMVISHRPAMTGTAAKTCG